jgi:hypothetical protein
MSVVIAASNPQRQADHLSSRVEHPADSLEYRFRHSPRFCAKVTPMSAVLNYIIARHAWQAFLRSVAASLLLRAVGGGFFRQYQFPLCPIHLHRQLVQVQIGPEGGELFRWQFGHEAEGGCGHIGAVFLECHPVPVEFLQGAPCGIAAAWISQ